MREPWNPGRPFSHRALAVLLAAGAASAQGANMPRADEAFMKQAAQNGHAEVESSKLALGKASSPDVKTFAEQMVNDHTKAGDELTALAQSKGVKVSNEPSVAQRAKIKLMQSLDGASFDRSYASSTGVSAHQETVSLFRKEAEQGKDPDVRAFAARTLPTLEHHLKMSKDLKAKTGAEKTGSSGNNRPQ